MNGLLTEEVEATSTKSKIFKIAARLFAEKGYNGVSMREISEVSGVSKPTIYYYFGSKEGIYRELLNTGLDHIKTSVNKVQSLPIPVREKLIMLTKNYFRETVQHPEYLKFFLTIFTISQNIGFPEEFKTEVLKQWYGLADLIKEGRESGEFGVSAKPELAAAIIASVLGAFIWRQLGTETQILSDCLAEEIIEILFKGLNE